MDQKILRNRTIDVCFLAEGIREILHRSVEPLLEAPLRPSKFFGERIGRELAYDRVGHGVCAKKNSPAMHRSHLLPIEHSTL